MPSLQQDSEARETPTLAARAFLRFGQPPYSFEGDHNTAWTAYKEQPLIVSIDSLDLALWQPLS